MRKVMVFLDDETAGTIEKLAKEDYRSVKSMTEKIIMEKVRSDGLTDTEYVRLSKTARGKA